MAEADAGVPHVRCFWEYKFTSRANMKKVYQTERGWSRLGPPRSDRVEHAYENGHIGEEFFLTLAPGGDGEGSHEGSCGLHGGEAPRHVGNQKYVQVHSLAGREIYKAILAEDTLWRDVLGNVRAAMREAIPEGNPLGAQLLRGPSTRCSGRCPTRSRS